jgi:hypothetical protein
MKRRFEVRFSSESGHFVAPHQMPLWADSVEKVASLKSLKNCQNTNDIFD